MFYSSNEMLLNKCGEGRSRTYSNLGRFPLEYVLLTNTFQGGCTYLCATSPIVNNFFNYSDVKYTIQFYCCECIERFNESAFHSNIVSFYFFFKF